MLSTRLFQTTNPFDTSLAKNVSEICKIHTEKFLNDLKKINLWALKSEFQFFF